jgi:hypothetical protein
MSFIPNKAMHHAHTEEAAPAEDGKIVPAAFQESSASRFNWVIGAAGAGVAVAAVAAALFSLRSSSGSKPSHRANRGKARKSTRSKSARSSSTRKKAAA